MRCRIPNNDLPQKLSDTVCRYNGYPVFVTTERSNVLHLFHLPTREPFDPSSIRSNDENLDISSVPLGYINMPGKVGKDTKNVVYYLMRNPLRRVKQGVTANSLKVYAMNRNTIDHSTTSIMFSQGFVDMVLGKYTTLENSLAMLKKFLKESPDSNHDIAISRDIALSIDKMGIIKVFFKREYVGWIPPNSTVVHVPNDGLAWVVSKFLSHVLGWKVD